MFTILVTHPHMHAPLFFRRHVPADRLGEVMRHLGETYRSAKVKAILERGK